MSVRAYKSEFIFSDQQMALFVKKTTTTKKKKKTTWRGTTRRFRWSLSREH